jgi:hypothetical protein
LRLYRLCVSFVGGYKLGWRAHTLVSMKALPITYIVRAANVNGKVLVKPLMRKASRLLRFMVNAYRIL